MPPTGTKQEMIKNLLAPCILKYKMDGSKLGISVPCRNLGTKSNYDECAKRPDCELKRFKNKAGKTKLKCINKPNLLQKLPLPLLVHQNILKNLSISDANKYINLLRVAKIDEKTLKMISDMEHKLIPEKLEKLEKLEKQKKQQQLDNFKKFIDPEDLKKMKDIKLEVSYDYRESDEDEYAHWINATLSVQFTFKGKEETLTIEYSDEKGYHTNDRYTPTITRSELRGSRLAMKILFKKLDFEYYTMDEFVRSKRNRHPYDWFKIRDMISEING